MPSVVARLIPRAPRARLALVVAVLSATSIVALPSSAAAQGKEAGSSIFSPGYMDLGPTVGLGGIGEAGMAFGGRFERAIKRLPDLGNGTIGIQASVDIWNYNNRYVGTDYDFRYLNIGVTANYHFDVKSNPKLDPFFGLGLGNSSVSTDWAGDYSSGIYFIGRAGLRYFMKPRLALYGDVGAGASTLNVGVTFGLGGGK
ncbi:MAG: hypothetical protein IT359_03720 [Gemmatimonadaceae bacterium]|nr:hypothetical protein [Gemmatimonadaceae bacterium]